MRTPKQKHLRFEDRLIIQDYLDNSGSSVSLSRRLNKDRTTISREVLKHRFIKGSSDEECDLLVKYPYVCNGCEHKQMCFKKQYRYDASVAHNEYIRTLKKTRFFIKASKDDIATLNQKISPLMIEKHHSVNQVYIEHPESINVSKSTFYRYIDMGLLNVKNVNLARKVRYKVKKEYDYTRLKTNPKIKIGRFIEDFRDFILLNPETSIVEMDTVIGTRGGKGGKCFLTLLFRKFNFMIIFILPYKKQEFVTKVFILLQKLLGEVEYSRLFGCILTDNGIEFMDPESIEFSFETGVKLTSVFYCDPNCSWQKGQLERNHEYIRYVLPKGTSFSGLTQEDCNLLASHINSVPRVSLNNNCPYDLALPFIGQKNMDKLNIKRIPYDDIDLSIRLLKK